MLPPSSTTIASIATGIPRTIFPMFKKAIAPSAPESAADSPTLSSVENSCRRSTVRFNAANTIACAFVKNWLRRDCLSPAWTSQKLTKSLQGKLPSGSNGRHRRFLSQSRNLKLATLHATIRAPQFRKERPRRQRKSQPRGPKLSHQISPLFTSLGFHTMPLRTIRGKDGPSVARIEFFLAVRCRDSRYTTRKHLLRPRELFRQKSTLFIIARFAERVASTPANQPHPENE